MYDYIVRNTKTIGTTYVASFIFIIIGIILIIYRGSPFMGAAITFLGVLALISAIRAPKTDNRTIEQLKASGKFDEAEKDFDDAKPFCENLVRVGNKYIFRYQYPVIIDISLIESIYTLSSRDDSGNAIVNIGVSLSSGRNEKLCSLGGYPDDPWVGEVVDYVMSKNPLIVKE